MLVHIDTQSAQPIYAQIMWGIRRGISSGDVGVGERLPPARELARSLDVNMHTVLRAYAELRDDGLIELRRGRGAVVLRGPSSTPAEVSDAIDELLLAARRHGVPVDQLHKALDEGATQ